MNTDIFENFCRNGLCDGEEGMCMFICQCPGIRFKDTKQMVTKEFAESYENLDETTEPRININRFNENDYYDGEFLK